MRSHQYRFVVTALLVAVVCVAIALFLQWRHNERLGNKSTNTVVTPQDSEANDVDDQAGAHPFIQALQEGVEQAQDKGSETTAQKSAKSLDGAVKADGSDSAAAPAPTPTPIKFSPSSSSDSVE